ncbi:type I glutamate--ammonia ligase [Kosmotoga pacifica]|uniref:Glutamine synthetase n=1 Tax=Kosmotoga pacifica TaxID=1330330 RepID=A0A0G2ZDE6_9BACT|nr:type I glutamate--ammonia ligase [Kosmotoga pacifica]AKI98096.1 glutamine synthetase [Kosmotoga pacifica]
MVRKILEFVEKEEVKLVRLQITDINGTLKNVELPVKRLGEALTKGVMFDGSSIDGFVRIEESDMILYPDTETASLLPWKSESEKTIRLICDVMLPDGTPFEGDPRYRLRKIVEKAKKMGFEAFAGPEPEFFLIRKKSGDPKEIELLDKGGYFDMLPVDKGEEVRKSIVIALEKMGFEVETAHHEVAHSQHEVDFRYTDILRTADNIQTFKWVVKTVSVLNGLHATFMPKPFMGINGSGMHIHLSLFSKGENAFYDPHKPYELSETAIFFIGGVLKYAAEITAVTNPTINSYKRLVPGYEAPVNISWALGNRSALIRVPSVRGEATRIEIRNPDPTCNPYLALAVILAAGLKGIEENILPPKPIDRNIFELDSGEKLKRKIEHLPADLKEATAKCEKSELVRDTLGEHIFEKFIETKRLEWTRFMRSVTDWELAEYIDLF